MSILDTVDKIIELESLDNLTVELYMNNLNHVHRVIRWLNSVTENLSSYKLVITAAYGLHNNKYLNVYYKLKTASEYTTERIKTLEELSTLPSMTKKLPHQCFAITELCAHFKQLKEIIGIYLEAEENALKLHKLALRYNKNSKYNIAEDGDNIFVSFLTIEENDTENKYIHEVNYNFNGWEQWSTTKLINKTDADKWPILKSVYPEQYI